MTMIYKCDKCNKTFHHKNDYKKHTMKKKSCIGNTQNYIKITQKNKKAFECSKCNKTYTRKDNLKRHIISFCKLKNNFKGEIEDILLMERNDNSLNSIVDKNKTISISDKFKGNSSTNSSTNSSIKISPTTEIPSIKKKLFNCQLCHKTFTRQDNLIRHQNGKCSGENENNKQSILDQILEEMKSMKNENLELKLKVEKLENNNTNSENIINSSTNIQNNSNNTTNNTQNYQINNNNNINLIAFGKEKLDEIIGDDECKKILFRGFEAVPQLIESVHFNKNRPQYHNCYIPNMRGKYAIVFDGADWKLENYLDVIEKLTENKKSFLERKFDDFYESLDKQTKTKFDRFLLEADTDIVKNRYKESLRLLLYNKKGIVIETRNKNDNVKLIK